MSSYKVLAKSNGTSLKEHTGDSLKVLDYLLHANNELLENWGKINEIDTNKLFKSLRTSAFFHDFGKGVLKWQEEVLKEEPHLPPHAQYSGYFLSQNEKDIFSLLACISHHSLLTESSFERTEYPHEFNENYLNQLANNCGYKLSFDLSWKNYFENLKKFKRDSQHPNIRKKWIKQINTKFKAKYCLLLSYLTTSDGIASKIEEENQIDALKVDENLKRWFPSSKDIYNQVSEIEGDKQLTEIQRKVLDNLTLSSNIFDLSKPLRIEAPCGEGKTLAALLVSKELLKQNMINKVIFTLPTQVTTNNMVQEFEMEYGIPRDWIGVYHSEVMSFLIETNDKESEYDFSLSSQKFWNLIYAKQFNISTIDHLLLSLVNGFKFAPRAFGNILNSFIVIDELHYYDSHTIGMVECLCEILRYLKIPHLIMSATMPLQIKEKFDGEYVKIQSSGKDNANNEKTPFVFEYHNKQICDDETICGEFLEILNESSDINVGIIVNTVPNSKKIFAELKERYPKRQILLYNSQFMRKDRPKKEKILRIFGKALFENLNSQEIEFCKDNGFDPKLPFIFIGTQVAEISLNISFDLILSDLAPLDALIQRGGRLHRTMSFSNSGKCKCPQCDRFDNKHIYKFHVFDTGEFCYPYHTKKDDNEFMKEIIDNTRIQISENTDFNFKKGIKMMNAVYQNEEMFSEFNADISFWNAYKEDLIFGKPPHSNEEDDGQLRIRTRDIGRATFDVLPQEFSYDGDLILAEDFIEKMNNDPKFSFKGKLKFEGINEISKHLLKISPSQYYKINNNETVYVESYKFIKVINAEYSFESGLADLNSIF